MEPEPAAESDAERQQAAQWVEAVLQALALTPEEWGDWKRKHPSRDDGRDRPDGRVREMLRAGLADMPIALPPEHALDADPRDKSKWVPEEIRVQTALMMAASHNRMATALPVASLLLDHGADAATPDTDATGGGERSITPLIRATVDGQLEMVSLLLLRGKHSLEFANPTTGETAYTCACAFNRADCAEALVRAGANTHAKVWHRVPALA